MGQRMTYTYNFHGIFSIESNIRFFEGFYHAFKGEGPAQFRMTFLEDNSLRISKQGKAKVNIMLYHNPSDGAVEFDFPWLRPVCARLTFEDNASWRFVFNKNYRRLAFLVGAGWDLLSVFRSLLLVSLLQHGMYMIHGGAVKLGEEGILIPAISNTGKSRASWMLAHQGALYLSDEYPVLLADGTCYSFRCRSLVSASLMKELGLKLTRRERLSLAWNTVFDKVLSYKFAQGGIKLYPDRFLKTSDKARVTRIFFIQAGVDGIRKVDAREAITKIKAIQDYETKWKTNPYLLAHTFFNRFDLDALVQKEETFLQTLLARIDELYLISSGSGEHYKLIRQLVGDKAVLLPTPPKLPRTNA